MASFSGRMLSESLFSSAAAASGSASQASAAAAAAAQSAANGETANKNAQSWAVGGTGTRPGEDTNNAKYWAEHAEAVAGGDFATKSEAQGYVTAHNENVNAHPDLRVAVAGSVRYDEAQSLTDEQKAQARGNINAAPGGYGFGGEPIKTVSATSKDETYESFCARLDEVMSEMPNNSVKLLHVYPPQIYGKSSSTCSIVFQHTDGYCGVYNIGMPDPTCSQWRMIKVAGVWQPFEWVNPPMLNNVDYATIERYMGKPVHRGFLGDFEVWGYDKGPGWMSAGKSITYILDAGGTKNISLYGTGSYIFSASDNARAGVAIVQCTNGGINAVTPLVPLRYWKIEAGSGLSVNVTETSGQYSLYFHAMML